MGGTCQKGILVSVDGGDSPEQGGKNYWKLVPKCRVWLPSDTDDIEAGALEQLSWKGRKCS